MAAAITCASCNRPLRVPEDVLGRSVQCPLCLDEFVAQADPAAEAAAPRVRREAPRPQVVAAAETGFGQTPLPAVDDEPAEAVPVVEAAPEKPPARKAAGRRALVFPVLVTRDPDRVLRGRMDGELNADGLYLRKMRLPPAFAAVGGRARYLGGNRLAVTVEGREVELAVVKPWASTHHLAKDAAAYLNGGDFPDGRAYNLPWYLYAVPPLFLALPFVAAPFGLITDGFLGAFLWICVALLLGGAALAVALQSWLKPRARLIGAACLLALGAVSPLLALPFTPSYTVDPSLWKSFAPPDGDFSVLMPAPVRAGVQNNFVNGVAAEKYTADVTDPDVQFAVFVAPGPANAPNGFQPFWNPANQAVNDAKVRLQQEYGAGVMNAVILQYPERDLAPGGRACHEVLYKIFPAYSYNSGRQKMLAARIYVVNNKVYTLTAMGPRVKADGADVLKFFNSVQFTNAGPMKGGGPARPASTSPKDLDGLLAYWSFDQNQNGAFVDESGNNLKGWAHQATIVPDGARGGAMRFNGRGSYFSFNDADGLDFDTGDEFTFCGWVRTRSPQGVILSNRSAQDDAPVIDLLIVNGRLTTQVRQDGNFLGGDDGARVSGVGVSDGRWHHFAVTRHGVGAVGLTVDGVPQGEQQSLLANGPITTDLRALGAELYWQQTQGNVPNSVFTGDVDEFCVYGRALAADEIRRLAGVGP